MEIGARRVAQTTLRCAGGQAVSLRMPVAATVGLIGEQLGLPTAGVSDIELAPVFVRGLEAGADGERWELLAGASAVALLAGDATVETALGMFATAVGVVMEGQVLRINAVSHRTVGAGVYLYRLELVGPVRETT